MLFVQIGDGLKAYLEVVATNLKGRRFT